MLFKYIAIGCKELSASQKALSAFGFSVTSQTSNTCILESNRTQFVCLRDSATSRSRVTRLAFSASDLSPIQQHLRSLGVPVSPIYDSCEVNAGCPFIDYPTTLPHLTHRVYEEPSDRLPSSPDRIPSSPDRLPSSLDHVLICCEKKTAARHAKWYADVLALEPYQCEDTRLGSIKVDVNGSGMEMFVNTSPELPIFAFSEPITSPETMFNQVERFVCANGGGGVQHLALRTPDIFTTVERLRERGVRVIEQPASYYNLVEKQEQFAKLGVEPQIAYQNSVIVDEDSDGFLLQVFTESIFDKDGLFLEIIDRRGCRGFGTGNVKALFSALENKQRNARIEKSDIL